MHQLTTERYFGVSKRKDESDSSIFGYDANMTTGQTLARDQLQNHKYNSIEYNNDVG